MALRDDRLESRSWSDIATCVGYGSESRVNQGEGVTDGMVNTRDACMHVHMHTMLVPYACTRHAQRNFQEFQKLKTHGSFSLLSVRVRPMPS